MNAATTKREVVVAFFCSFSPHDASDLDKRRKIDVNLLKYQKADNDFACVIK